MIIRISQTRLLSFLSSFFHINRDQVGYWLVDKIGWSEKGIMAMMPFLTDVSLFWVEFRFLWNYNKSTVFTQDSLLLSHDGFHKNNIFFMIA
jgi:hypothetical protein